MRLGQRVAGVDAGASASSTSRGAPDRLLLEPLTGVPLGDPGAGRPACPAWSSQSPAAWCTSPAAGPGRCSAAPCPAGGSEQPLHQRVTAPGVVLAPVGLGRHVRAVVESTVVLISCSSNSSGRPGASRSRTRWARVLQAGPHRPGQALPAQRHRTGASTRSLTGAGWRTSASHGGLPVTRGGLRRASRRRHRGSPGHRSAAPRRGLARWPAQTRRRMPSDEPP